MNEIVFLILLSGCSLQVYSITIDFCVLILYSAALLILFISSNCVHLCVCVFFKKFSYKRPCHLQKRLSYFFLPIWMSFMSYIFHNQFPSVQFSCSVATPWAVACQASLSITNSQSLLKLMPIELVMPSNHLILCHPLLLLPSIFPSIRVFFRRVSSLHQVAKVLEFQLQHQSFQRIFRTYFL